MDLSISSDSQFYGSEEARRAAFPVCNDSVFLAHAAVTVLPKVSADAMSRYAEQSALLPQEFGQVLRDFQKTRELAAQLIGARWEEIALIGPTSLGLSLFANGYQWIAGDEVVYYADDYPANVYPWIELERRGVVCKPIRAKSPGEITPELVLSALGPRTRMVALASCHFFSGYRLDVEGIGAVLRERGILFALDAIQTLGAFPLDVVRASVDMLSADAHKWLLGPMAIGIVYVAERHFDRIRPTLLGAWNVQSPRFLAQDRIEFVPTARRYEPGVLNAAGVYGMKASLELLLGVGVERVAARLIRLKQVLLDLLEPLGFELMGVRGGVNASGITTVWHPDAPSSALMSALEAGGVVASLRHDAQGREYLRFSPHFYNTEAELARVAGLLEDALKR
jgi:selenocysteine lyase/cysteine desulfurase